MKRLSEYADWVELLFQYADQAILTTGDYDAQVSAFANGKAAFLHQGNWTDPNMKDVTFRMAFAPHGSMRSDTDGIFVLAPSWYVINKESKNVEAAKKFLADMVATEAGHKYMVEEAGMIPAFANVKLNPTGQLSTSVQNWAARGKIYSWNQYLFTNEFRDQVLAPIYNQFALNEITKDEFTSLLAYNKGQGLEAAEIFAQHGLAALKVYKEQGLEAAEIFAQHGPEALEYYKEYGPEAAEIFVQHGQEALAYYKEHGLEAARLNAGFNLTIAPDDIKTILNSPSPWPQALDRLVQSRITSWLNLEDQTIPEMVPQPVLPEPIHLTQEQWEFDDEFDKPKKSS